MLARSPRSDEMDDGDLHRLLQVVAAEETIGIPLPPYAWIGRNVSVTPGDPQQKLHIDTFAPIVKVRRGEARARAMAPQRAMSALLSRP